MMTDEWYARTADIPSTNIEEVEGVKSADEIIRLITALNLVKIDKIHRLESYIEYREKRHEIDREDIDKLKEYLKEVKNE